MSFPFGNFKTPEKKKKGRYSGANRDFKAEMEFDEGDPDSYKVNFREKIWKNEKHIERYKECWDEVICPKFKEATKSKKGEPEKSLEDLNVWIVGQSHMDIAWLWRIYQIVNKAKITLAKAAFHSLNLEEFYFVFSQPFMLECVRKIYPKLFEKIKKSIKEGKFELQGGMWVECDGKTPSGESFCRQRLYGQKYYQDHFGKTAEIEWLPDSFGYNNNIPQIAAKSGAKYFFTQKIVGNYFVGKAGFPFSHFKWRSPNGSELICHSTNRQYRPLTRWGKYSNTRRILKEGEHLECNYSTRLNEIEEKMGEIWTEVLLAIGVGDGGHGPRSEEIYRANYYVEQGYLDGWTSILDYYEKYKEIEDRLPVWDGAELYYNLHRGTLTTQGLMKRMNRHFEWKINQIQSILSLAQFQGIINIDEEMSGKIEKIWKDTLLLQFHDILPGSSSPEVYDDCYDIWEENTRVLCELHRILMNALHNLNSLDIGERNIRAKEEKEGKEERGKKERRQVIANLKLVNGTDFTGRANIRVPVGEDVLTTVRRENRNNLKILGEGGEEYNFTILEPLGFSEKMIRQNNRLEFCPNLNAWDIHNFKIITLKHRKKTSKIENNKLGEKIYEPLNEEAWCITTKHSEIWISKKTGMILQYRDLILDRKILQENTNELKFFQDWSMVEPAWNIGAGYKQMPFGEDEVKILSVQLKEINPIKYTFERTIQLIDSETNVIQKIHIYKELAGIYFELIIDWKATETILKNYLDFATSNKFAIAEGPYTTEIYTADPGERLKLDRQRWESACHTWIAMQDKEEEYGVVLINDSKYGFDVNKSCIGLTIVRGPKYPEPAGNTYITKEREGRKEEEIPTHADQEEHYINYACIPYEGSWHKGKFPKRAHLFNTGVISECDSNPERKFFDKKWKKCELSSKSGGENLEIAGYKYVEAEPGNENTLIMRLTETGRKETVGVLDIPQELGVKDLGLVNILEENFDNSPILDIKREDRTIIQAIIRFYPHEIHTLKLSK